MRDDLIIRGNDDKIRFGVSFLILIYLLIQQYGKQDVEKKKEITHYSHFILILKGFMDIVTFILETIIATSDLNYMVKITRHN